MKSCTSKQSGFSLIEILVVLVIMGLLISVVAPMVLNRADEARIQKVYADFKSIETALKIYRLDNYNYPTTEQGLQALIKPSSLTPLPRNFKEGGYLAEIPMDPWGSLIFIFHRVKTRKSTFIHWVRMESREAMIKMLMLEIGNPEPEIL